MEGSEPVNPDTQTAVLDMKDLGNNVFYGG